MVPRPVPVLLALVALPAPSLAADAVAEKPAPEEAAAPDAAEAPADETKAWETEPHEHRGGFTAGLAVAGGIGAANGFPNDSKKIGRERYYTESGLGVAPSSALWLGGAFADWLNFGVGFGYSSIWNEATRSPAPIMMFHGDVYPLYPLGGQWRNVGAMLEAGLGFPQTTDVDTEEVLIDGAASFLFAGAFWEGIEAWKLKMGPYAGVHYMFSQTLRRPVAALGFRIAVYTDP